MSKVEQDANLMAAAPDLKAALEDLLNFSALLMIPYKKGTMEDRRYEEIRQRAQHALMKSWMGGQ